MSGPGAILERFGRFRPLGGLSLRKRLALLVIASVLPVVGFAAVNAYLNHRQDRERASERTLEIARGMSLVVERELQSAIAGLQGLAVSRALRSGDLSTFRGQAEQFLKALPPNSFVIVADENGQQLLNTRLAEGQPLPLRGDPAVSRRVFETGRPVISNLFTGRIVQRPVISVDVPVLRDGRVVYELALNYPLERFAEIIAQQRPPANWTIGVFDRAGTTVARVPNAERFIGQRASPSFYPHLMARNEGVVATRTHESVPALTAFSRSEPSGWSVGIGVPEREFTAPLWQSLLLTALLGGGFLLLGLSLAFWIARGIAEPIRSLARTATAPDGAGMLPETGLAEVDEVARQLREAIAERRSAEGAHRESEERFRLILESAKEYAIVALDAEGLITTWNAGAERILGYSEEEAIGQPGEIFFTDEDRAAGEPEREKARARAEGRAANERWHLRKDGSVFWGSGVMLPLAGHRRGFLKIFRDRTQERTHEEAQKLLIDELNHRVKNTLATVQSIAAQSLRSSETTSEARRSFEARLFALAKAHDVLTRESWEGASLQDIVEEALAPHRDARAARFEIGGPEARLPPRAALAISMALHELATNAAKYGALSNESGRVRLAWRVAPGEGGPMLHMSWTEEGGPPVSPPARKGFGSRLIERGLAMDLDGKVRLDFRGDGVVCTIEAPLFPPESDLRAAEAARIAAQ